MYSSAPLENNMSRQEIADLEELDKLLNDLRGIEECFCTDTPSLPCETKPPVLLVTDELKSCVPVAHEEISKKRVADYKIKIEDHAAGVSNGKNRHAPCPPSSTDKKRDLEYYSRRKMSPAALPLAESSTRQKPLSSHIRETIKHVMPREDVNKQPEKVDKNKILEEARKIFFKDPRLFSMTKNSKALQRQRAPTVMKTVTDESNSNMHTSTDGITKIRTELISRPTTYTETTCARSIEAPGTELWGEVLGEVWDEVQDQTPITKEWVRENSYKFSIEALLPDEMLVAIFGYLNVRETKNAKLVCQRWYDILNQPKFLKKQKIVCSGAYSTETIISLLQCSKTEYMNLEFHRINFDDSSISLWKVCGKKIRSLFFIDCVLSDMTMVEMIRKCRELQQLTIWYEHCRHEHGKQCFNSQLLTELVEGGVVKNKLKSLDIHLSNSEWMSNKIVGNLFMIYPNITKLGFECQSLDVIHKDGQVYEAVPPENIIFTDLWAGKKLTFSTILENILNRFDTMEKLRLNLYTKISRSGFAWESIMVYSKLTKLREIDVEIDLKCISMDRAIAFCIQQKGLKNFTCKIKGRTKVGISLLLTQLLDNCEHLREIDVTYSGDVLVSYELLRRLTISKLKSIILDVKKIALSPKIVEEKDEWPVNTTLRYLCTSRDVGQTFVNLLLQIFRGLQYLEVSDVTDKILQTIFKYQANLINLKLWDIENCTKAGFYGSPENEVRYSLQRLQKLESLVLVTGDNEWTAKADVWWDLVLPKLRYLCVDIEASSEVKTELMTKLADEFSTLECLFLKVNGIPRPTWLTFTTLLSRLRYLKIVDKESTRFKAKQYENFFKRHPTLRALVHEFNSGTESYYLDTVEKTIKRKETASVKYRVSSEKIGYHFVSWLWF